MIQPNHLSAQARVFERKGDDYDRSTAAGCTRYPGGKDAIQAIADAYGLSRTDAFKRMGRVLKHREVNFALEAVTQGDRAHPRKLMVGCGSGEVPTADAPNVKDHLHARVTTPYPVSPSGLGRVERYPRSHRLIQTYRRVLLRREACLRVSARESSSAGPLVGEVCLLGLQQLYGGRSAVLSHWRARKYGRACKYPDEIPANHSPSVP